MVGSRTAKNLMELPGAISIINSQQIADLNAVEVYQVLQFGVAWVTQNQTINDDVNIRGFRTTFSLRDGITQTSFKRSPMFDVERIEVGKGPVAMLIGNNSFLDVNTTLGTASAPMTARLNQNSGKSFSPGRSRDAFWDNQDSFFNATLLTSFTENANLPLACYFSNLVNRRRIVRGITIRSDNRTLNRQDIPLAIDACSQNVQMDFTHKLSGKAMTLDSTFGADLQLNFQRQDQSVNVMQALDTSAINFAADDAYFCTPRPGAGLPNLSQNITRPESFFCYFQENLTFLNDKVILVGGLRWFLPGGTNKNNIMGVVTDRPDKSFRTHKYGIVIHPSP